MQALLMAQPGPLSGMTVATVPDPRPRSGEVIVKVAAAGINVSDTKNAQGQFPQTIFPCIPGRDFAGIVEEGPGLWRARRVFGSGAPLGFVRPGSHAQYLAVPEEALVLSPDDLSDDRLAAMGVPYTTAWRGLMGQARLQAGETVVIAGVTGAVGLAALSLARAHHARVIGVGRRPEALRALPLDAFVDTTRQELQGAVMEMTGGGGADVVFDAVGGESFASHAACLGKNGRMVVLASSGSRMVSFDLVDFYHSQAQLTGVDSMQFSLAESQRILLRVTEKLRPGGVLQPELAVADLTGARALYRRTSQGQGHQRGVIRPWG